MGKRPRIGIFFVFDENWVGGSYYLMNLVNALNHLDEADQPDVVILSWEEKDFQRMQQTGYPRLSFFDLSMKPGIGGRAVNKILRPLTGKNVVKRTHVPADLVDMVFPYNGNEKFDLVPKKVYWVPDFQEHYLPQFFTEKELNKRKSYQAALSQTTHTLVLSSKSAQDDYHQFFPAAKNRTAVLNFAVTHPRYDQLDIAQLREKFNITAPYYMVPNQFWAHKNHFLVLKAIAALKEQELTYQVVFTGKEYDNRNPDYYDQLQAFIQANGIESYVRFLGFIDRDEQLQLMNNAMAVIQPSLFEGWSTVVEDSKAMGQYILASNFKVHLEQLYVNHRFFDPESVEELSALMQEGIAHGFDRENLDYSLNVKKFAADFVSIVRNELA